MHPATEAGAQAMRGHGFQRALDWWLAPCWVPLAGLWLRYGFGCRIEGAAGARRTYRRLREEQGPLLICANHLTLVDSFFIAQALSSSWRYLIDFDSLPWNTPEETNFADTRLNRLLVYSAKCVPIRRGGARSEVKQVLDRVAGILDRGEVVLLFPEGGRSRSGRVSDEGAGWGVGRILARVEGCRVLCVYMRGDGQESWSDLPARGDRLRVSLACIEPKSDARGVRRTRDLAAQVIAQLVELEAAHFAGGEHSV
jgi:hypothetical protein